MSPSHRQRRDDDSDDREPSRPQFPWIAVLTLGILFACCGGMAIIFTIAFRQPEPQQIEQTPVAQQPQTKQPVQQQPLPQQVGIKKVAEKAAADRMQKFQKLAAEYHRLHQVMTEKDALKLPNRQIRFESGQVAYVDFRAPFQIDAVAYAPLDLHYINDAADGVLLSTRGQFGGSDWIVVRHCDQFLSVEGDGQVLISCPLVVTGFVTIRRRNCPVLEPFPEELLFR